MSSNLVAHLLTRIRDLSSSFLVIFSWELVFSGVASPCHFLLMSVLLKVRDFMYSIKIFTKNLLFIADATKRRFPSATMSMIGMVIDEKLTELCRLEKKFFEVERDPLVCRHLHASISFVQIFKYVECKNRFYVGYDNSG